MPPAHVARCNINIDNPSLNIEATIKVEIQLPSNAYTVLAIISVL